MPGSTRANPHYLLTSILWLTIWLLSVVGSASAAIHTSTAPPATPGVVQLTAIARDALGQETTSAVTSATTIRLYAPGTAGITYYHHDLAGSVIGATDALGAVLWQESYLPYGERLEPRSTPDSTETAQQGGNRLWFHGKAEDSESGLQYFGARYYDPVIGRFLSIDPAGVEPGNVFSFNRYAYGNGNPYKYLDPDGNQAVPLIATPGFATSGAALGRGSPGFQAAGPQPGTPGFEAMGPQAAQGTPGFAIAGNPLPQIPGFGAMVGVLVDLVMSKGVDASRPVNAARLRGQLTGQEIASGHAFDKHVLDQGQFKGLGIRTREQFANHIENVVNNPTASSQLSGGRSAYWQESTRTVVIRNPRAADGGTAFQPTNGRAYFDGLR